MTEITDNERLMFLCDLDDRDDVDVTRFEADFIESALRQQTSGYVHFSDKQRAVIANMMERYE